MNKDISEIMTTNNSRLAYVTQLMTYPSLLGIRIASGLARYSDVNTSTDVDLAAALKYQIATIDIFNCRNRNEKISYEF